MCRDAQYQIGVHADIDTDEAMKRLIRQIVLSLDVVCSELVGEEDHLSSNLIS